MILKNKNIVLCMLASPFLLSSGEVWANKTVDAPYVDKGAAYLEWKGGYDIDNNGDVDGGWVQEGNVGYGITDYWNFEIGGAFEHEGSDGDNTDFKTIVIDNRFELTQPGEYFVDFGFSVAYAIAADDEDADAVEGKLLFAKDIGKFSSLANIIIAREVGSNSSDDMDYGFAWSTSYAITDEFAAGLELYSGFGDFEGDFDEQSHQIGPVVYGSFGEGVEYETGVLLGLSNNAPDAQLKAVVNYTFDWQ